MDTHTHIDTHTVHSTSVLNSASMDYMYISIYCVCLCVCRVVLHGNGTTRSIMLLLPLTFDTYLRSEIVLKQELNQ